jgi:hypothetical protein
LPSLYAAAFHQQIERQAVGRKRVTGTPHTRIRWNVRWLGRALINHALLQRGEFAHHGSVAQMFSLSNGDREAHKCFNEVAQ